MPEMMTDAERARWEEMFTAGLKAARKAAADAGLKVPHAPGADNVLVLRVPSKPVEKNWDRDGLIVRPDKYQEEPEPESEGYLLRGGPMALNSFMDEGYLLGDKVQIGRFAGWEKEFDLDRKGANKKKILQMKAGDVIGSFDLLDRLDGPKPSMRMVLGADEVYVVRVIV
jgi:hypothetical protein